MNKKHVSIGVFLVAIIAVSTQISFITLGDKYNGSTAVVWKTGPFSKLKFFDSARSACKRAAVDDQRIADAVHYLGPSLCEGVLAISIAGSKNDLMRLPYSSLITSIAE